MIRIENLNYYDDKNIRTWYDNDKNILQGFSARVVLYNIQSVSLSGSSKTKPLQKVTPSVDRANLNSSDWFVLFYLSPSDYGRSQRSIELPKFYLNWSLSPSTIKYHYYS